MLLPHSLKFEMFYRPFQISTTTDPGTLNHFHAPNVDSVLTWLFNWKQNSVTAGLLTFRKRTNSTAVAKWGHSLLSCHSDRYRKEVESHLKWWLLDSSSAKTQLPSASSSVSYPHLPHTGEYYCHEVKQPLQAPHVIWYAFTNNFSVGLDQLLDRSSIHSLSLTWSPNYDLLPSVLLAIEAEFSSVGNSLRKIRVGIEQLSQKALLFF